MILQIEGLSKRYTPQAEYALRGVNLQIRKGELIGIIGPSGAGKSTLLRCINRLIEPTEGKIILEGMDLLSLSGRGVRLARRKVGMIFQHYNLVNRLTVLQNVLHGRLGYMNTLDGVLGRYKEEDKKRAIELLERTGLHPFMYQRASELSGGQKQRVGIVRAMMQQPSIMLCDEPIASLDPASSRVIMDLLKGLCRDYGITCLVNLHQVDVAKNYSDRVVGMRSGVIAYDGDAKNLDDAVIEAIYERPISELIMHAEQEHAG